MPFWRVEVRAIDAKQREEALAARRKLILAGLEGNVCGRCWRWKQRFMELVGCEFFLFGWSWIRNLSFG